MTIGIPKALTYFKSPHFWEAFFEGLGFKVVMSPDTNREIVGMGVKVADPETCFSTKVYWGHLLWLEGKCDFIFVPRLKTDRHRLEYCPKFFGLPDLAKIIVKTPILTEVFDEKKQSFERSLEKIGSAMKSPALRTRKAHQFALLKQKEFKEKQNKDFSRKMSSKKPKIILISHQYNLYDDYVNLRARDKLRDLGVEPVFIDEVYPEAIPFVDKTSNLSGVDFHWEFGREMSNKLNEVLKYTIVGGIQISSFQCGCDAVLKEFIEKEFRGRKIPFLYIIIDEHTGEAGLQTRLEAFVDTLKI